MIVYKSCAATGGDKEPKIGSPYRFDSYVAPACLELRGKLSGPVRYQLGGTREQAPQETKSS